MSRRSRTSRSSGHAHCESCYSRRCRARVEVSVSCALASCRLHCGASFHLCKEEEHLLLCPNVRAPCLNAAFGCPLQLPRASRAAHLRECPASVVSCSMDWLRWLTDDTEPHAHTALQDNVMGEWEERRAEALELGMALVDQAELYSRLKMKPLYPELMEEQEEEEEEEEEVEEEEPKKEEKATEALMNAKKELSEDHTQTAARQREAASGGAAAVGPSAAAGINVEKHKLFEMMFSMERGGCTAAQENLNKPEPAEEEAVKEAEPPQDTGKTGLAPWQDGVLDRLREDLTPQEYNMYMVHHGRMLLAFGQIEACTPRDKDFVYGSLEPIPVQTLRSFKVPDSYRYRRRVHLADTASRVRSEARGTDTSDLGGDEGEWLSDEAEATLLGYAEKEVKGHKICAPKAADGLYCDVGTQTFSFRSAPFAGGKTTLAEATAGRPLRLRLRLQAESVNSRHHRGSSVFAFICGHTFHRKEFAAHFRNVHADVQAGLSGWFQQRCPLAYLGCTYTRRRFQPSTQAATVTYDQQLRSFNLRPTVEEPLRSAEESRGGGAGGGEDALSALPYEVLCHMASFLDSLSLSQLALVSHLMRQVCWSLLGQRGMVSLRWERKSSSRAGARWTSVPVWTFSRLFSPVDSWRMTDEPPISAHLKVCPYYRRSERSEPVPLLSMREAAAGAPGGPSLVNHFTRTGQK